MVYHKDQFSLQACLISTLMTLLFHGTSFMLTTFVWEHKDNISDIEEVLNNDLSWLPFSETGVYSQAQPKLHLVCFICTTSKPTKSWPLP